MPRAHDGHVDALLPVDLLLIRQQRHPNGIAMVVIAIVADAVSSAVQEKVDIDPNPKPLCSLPFSLSTP